MKSPLAAAFVILASALLAACPGAPTDKTASPPEDQAAQSPEFGAGNVRASLNGASEVNMTASECMIINGGTNGVVRAGEGSFELNWADGAYRVIWSSDSGLYQGEVTGSVDGAEITFQGTADGASVAGVATCH